MMRRLPSLSNDDRGVAVMEFALFVPVLALFVLGIVDLSRGIAERYAMQQAVNRSLELLLVRAPQMTAQTNANDSFAYIEQEAAAAADVPRSQVSLTRRLECNGNPVSNYDSICAQGQESTRYVSLTVRKTFNGTFYLGAVPLQATGTMRIQ